MTLEQQIEALALLREYATAHKIRPDLNNRAVTLFRELNSAKEAA